MRERELGEREVEDLRAEVARRFCGEIDETDRFEMLLPLTPTPELGRELPNPRLVRDDVERMLDGRATLGLEMVERDFRADEVLRLLDEEGILFLDTLDRLERFRILGSSWRGKEQQPYQELGMFVFFGPNS